MNRIIMRWVTAAALLIAVSATPGKTAEINVAASDAAALDDAAAALSESVLWSFGASGDGYFPEAGLLADKWGNLYGTTEFGGANTNNSCVLGCGTVFKLSPPAGQQTQWRERVLWSFGASGDGEEPQAGLLADKWGNLYGTTTEGGANAIPGPLGPIGGTVFELSPPAGQQTQWRERVLWSFGASGDGLVPVAGLLADKWGNLYGTTELGGANSCSEITCGTVFELDLPY